MGNPATEKTDSSGVAVKKQPCTLKVKLLAAGGLACVLAGATSFRADSLFQSSNRPHHQRIRHAHYSSDVCAQPSPAATTSNYSAIYDTEEFVQASGLRLSGAIQIPTMSFDDMGEVGVDDRWLVFGDLHAYLKKTFPLVHQTMELTVVGGYSLVYTWKGEATNLKPIMLTGHQDVVPAISVLDRWEYPPFAGVIDADGWVHGRGSSDCKNNVIGLLTSAENLIASGFVPQRTIIYAFGQDEESSGKYGAINIETHLEGIYGKHGIAMIVDEGGMGLETLYGKTFALPGTAEKGYGNFKIDVDMLGGHSSVPAAHSSVGMLAKIVSAVEDADLFPPTLKPVSPLYGYLQCLAAHGDEELLPSWIEDAAFSKHPDFKSVAENFAEMSLPNRYLIQTSKAATVFHGGVKVNALPETASATFNSRIESFSSVESTLESYLSIITPIAKKYSLTVNGKTYNTESSSIGNITVTPDGELGPSPISPLTSRAWEILKKGVQASFGPDVITSPSAMTGNTDTRFYWNLSKNIYRWSPAFIGTRLNAHTVGEKLKLSSHIDGIKFYTELIVATNEVDTDEGF